MTKREAGGRYCGTMHKPCQPLMRAAKKQQHREGKVGAAAH